MHINIVRTISEYSADRGALRLVNRAFYAINVLPVIRRVIAKTSLWQLEDHHIEVLVTRTDAGRPLLADVLIELGFANPMPMITLLATYYTHKFNDDQLLNSIVEWQRQFYGVGHAIDYGVLREPCVRMPTDFETLEDLIVCMTMAYNDIREPGFLAIENQAYRAMCSRVPSTTIPYDHIYNYMVGVVLGHIDGSLALFFTHNRSGAEKALLSVSLKYNTNTLYARFDVPGATDVLIEAAYFNNVVSTIAPITDIRVVCNAAGRLRAHQAARLLHALYMFDVRSDITALMSNMSDTFGFICAQTPARRADLLHKLWKTIYIVLYACAVMNRELFNTKAHTYDAKNEMMAVTIVVIFARLQLIGYVDAMKRGVEQHSPLITKTLYWHMYRLCGRGGRRYLTLHNNTIIGSTNIAMNFMAGKDRFDREIASIIETVHPGATIVRANGAVFSVELNHSRKKPTVSEPDHSADVQSAGVESAPGAAPRARVRARARASVGRRARSPDSAANSAPASKPAGTYASASQKMRRPSAIAMLSDTPPASPLTVIIDDEPHSRKRLHSLKRPHSLKRTRSIEFDDD